MENDYLNELEQQREANFERQQATERINLKQQFDDKIKKNNPKKNSVRQVKKIAKKGKMLVDIGRLVVTYGFDVTAWADIFRQDKLLGTLLLSAYLIFIITIVMLFVALILSSVCQSLNGFEMWLVNLVSDKLDFCKAFK